jgi:hypothetical protein
MAEEQQEPHVLAIASHVCASISKIAIITAGNR